MVRSATQTIRALVVATVLVTAVVGAGVASAEHVTRGSHAADEQYGDERRSDHPRQAYANESVDASEYRTNASEFHEENLSVSVSGDGDALVVTVHYEGKGSAHVSVDSPDGDYAGTVSFTVENGSETVELPWPDEPMTVVTAVDTERGSVEHRASFDVLAIGCGEASETVLVIDRVHHAWTLEGANGTHSDERTVDLERPAFECPEPPAGFDDADERPDPDDFDNVTVEEWRDERFDGFDDAGNWSED